MSGTEDLRNLLDRLKDEVGPVSDAAPRPARRPAGEFYRERERDAQARPRAAGSSLPARYEFRREEPESRPSGGQAWAENKEVMLFGALTSLIAALGGILGGVDYLVYIGAAGFTLFSLVTLLSLAGYYLNSLRRTPGNSGITRRVDTLSKRAETISPRGGSPGREQGGEKLR